MTPEQRKNMLVALEYGLMIGFAGANYGKEAAAASMPSLAEEALKHVASNIGMKGRLATLQPLLDAMHAHKLATDTAEQINNRN